MGFLEDWIPCLALIFSETIFLFGKTEVSSVKEKEKKKKQNCLKDNIVTSFVIRKVQINTRMRFHYAPIKMAKIQILTPMLAEM